MSMRRMPVWRGIARNCLIVTIIIWVSVTATSGETRQKRGGGNCATRLQACLSSNEKSPQRKKVCGNDNKTYSSRCQLIRAQCAGSPVVVKHRGKCYDNVDILPIRSSGRGGGMGRAVGDKKNKDCGRMDRTAFNNNLLHFFKNEYSRSPPPLVSGVDITQPSELDRVILEWKFSSLDIDKNNQLEKEEYRDLRRLVRKVVKPKRCSRTFAQMCDIDADERISRDEWKTCLGQDFNLLQGSVTSRASHLPVFTEDTVERKIEPEVAADCSSDRKGVLDEQRNGDEELYLPECKEDGRYNQIQCYKSTGYCWCVNEDNGKPIPGTSVKDQDPKCDSIAPPSRPMNGCPEPRKQEFLTELMDYLMKKMATGTTTNKSDAIDTLAVKGDTPGLWQVSREEHIAKWNFHTLDKNKNKVLERKEWKSLRALINIAATRQLRRCGKRLPRYCDVNHDRKISMTEWLNCLNPHRTNSSPRATTAPSRRRGLNPLEIYLNGDD